MASDVQPETFNNDNHSVKLIHILFQLEMLQVAQLSQRNRTAGWVVDDGVGQ